MKKVILTLLPALIFISSYSIAQDNPKRVEAESFSETDRATTKEGDGGTIVNKFDKGAWIKFDKVDFGKGTSQIKFRAGSGSTNGKQPQLEVKLGDHKGKSLGKVDITPKGWNKFEEYVLEIPKTKGKQTITIVSTGGGVILNWFELN